ESGKRYLLEQPEYTFPCQFSVDREELMAVLQITDSDGNVAEIDIRIDERGTGKAKWTCQSPSGAFSNRLTLDEWQEATVKWSTDFRDEYVGRACCYLD